MAQAVGNIHVGLLYDGRGMRGFSSAANTVLRDSDRMRRGFGNTQRSMDSLRHSMSHGVRSRFFTQALQQAAAVNNELARMRSMVMAIGAITGTSLGTAFAVTGLMQTADQAHLMRNQLRTVTESEQNLLAVRERLFQLSQETRSDLQSTITVYARLSRATEHLGLSQERLVRATETIQKAFAIGGATQQEAWGAAIQLSQGIASDRFSGEEFRSVAENAPVLLRGMAESLGIGIGKLREMAHAGQLTASVVTQAILDASDAIDANFAKIGVTVGQSLTRVQNAFLVYIGDADEAGGYTRALAHALTQLAENLDDVMVGVAGLAGLGLAWGGGRALSGIIGNQVQSTRELIKLRKQEWREAGRILVSRQKELGLIQQQMSAERQKITQMGALRNQQDITDKKRQYAIQRERSAYNHFVTLQERQVDAAKRLRDATDEVDRAQRRLTAGAVALQRIQRIGDGIGGGILNFMGGWTGAGFMAAIAGIGFYANEVQKARHRTDDLIREMNELGFVSDQFAGRIDGAARSLDELEIDELRVKLAELRDEMTRQLDGRPFWEQAWDRLPLVGQDVVDSNNFREIADQIDEAVRRGSSLAAAHFGDAAITSGFSVTDVPFLTQLNELRKQFEALEITGEEFNREVLALNSQFPNLSTRANEFSLAMRNAVTHTSSLPEYIAAVEAKFAAIAAHGGNPLATSEALRKVGEALAMADESRRSIEAEAAERVRIAGLTEEQARLEREIASLRKDAVSDKQEENAAVEADLVLAAKEIIAAEDRAEAAKKAREAIQRYREELEEIDRALTRMPEIGDNEAAVSNIRQMVAEFVTGDLEAATLHRRLDAIGETNISAGMDALIKKIKEAIPQAAAILNIMRKLPGMGFLGSVDDSDATGDTLPKVDTAAKAAADAAKRFREGMAELRREVEMSKMDKFISDIASTAQGLGIAGDELDAFIAAVQSGGLDAASQKFRDIADALRESRFNETLADLQFDRTLIGKSDVDVEIMKTLRDLGLDYNDVQGQIIAENIRLNATMEDSARLAEQMTNTLSSGVADIFIGLIDGSNSAADAVANLLKQLGSLLINNAFKMLFSGGGMGGGGGGLLGGVLIPGILHGGGKVGADGYGHNRIAPAALWAGAPRFHTGLRNNEFAAILEKNEQVITELQSKRLARVMGTVANLNIPAANDNGAGRGDLHVHINGSGLTEEQLGRAIANGIREYDGALAPKVEAKFRQMQSDPRAADGGW